MEKFVVNIYLRIITISDNDDNKILVFLDENSEIPKIQLSSNSNIDLQIEDKLKSLFYDNDLYTIISTKQFSEINTNNNKKKFFF